MKDKKQRAPATGDPRITLLVDNLERAYRGRSWHGTALKGTLRGLTPAVGLWRPGPDRRCAWEYLLHAAYWKYIVRKKLVADAITFPRQGSNFPRLPAPADPRALERDLALLEDQHALLRAAVLALDPAALDERRGEWRVVDYVLGAAAHDLYHAGQINLVKRLGSGR